MTVNNFETKNFYNIIYMILSINIVLFMTGKYAIMSITFVVIVWAILMMNIKDARMVRIDGLMLSFCAVIILSVLHGVLNISTTYSMYSNLANIFEEISRALVYILILQIILLLPVSIKVHLRIWKIVVFCSVFIAFLQYTKLYDINSILINVYGDSIQFYNTQYSSLDSFRSGSIFVNPNVYATFLVAVLGYYLVVCNRLKESVLRKIIMYGLICIGLLFSGSRTGMILSIVLLLVNMIIIKRGQFKVSHIFAIMTAIVMGIIIFLCYGISFSDFIGDARLLQIEAGLSNSFGIKIQRYSSLLEEMNAINVIFGYGPFDYTESAELLVDFEFGYITLYFGLCGLLLYVAMIYNILKYNFVQDNENKHLKLVMVIVMIFFGWTSGVYLHLRIFSTFILLFMPVVYSENYIVA
ncbi:MAG: hypothetical protein R3Y45_05370 [Bacillota bacterium]